jgi:lipooligosaccharide transport system ATP-binding protein
MDEAESLCDRLVIMDHGKVVAEGRPRALIAEHAAESVIEIQGAGNEIGSFLAARGVRFEDLGARIVVYTEEQGKLKNEIRDRFCHDSCLFRAGNLEDVFLRLTGRDLRE